VGPENWDTEGVSNSGHFGDTAAGTGAEADEFQLSPDSDLAAIDGDGGISSDVTPPRSPVVAVVGRPNVGKSTLVNRILGRREAVVQDIPGVTRDRVAYDATWSGRSFTLVDTGGWEPDARGLQARISAQAERAVETADVVLFVVDALIGATATDLAVARTLRRSKLPIILAATKVDDERAEADASQLWSLGLGEPQLVSGLHGRGSGDLLDVILEALPEAPRLGEFTGGGPRRVALIGRPNVGKSSLLNRVTGEQRSVVDSVAGTTIDPVDSLVDLDGETWRFIDTAGLRRRVNQAAGMEYYASLRTSSAIASAEVAIVLLDASEPLSEQDQRIIAQVVEAGRALVIAFNKWDLVDEDRHDVLDREISRDLARVQWAPRVNVSAKTGRAVDRLAVALRTSLASWDRRIPTGQLNGWLTEVVAQTPPPPRGGKAPRVLFATQADTRPPRFVLFTTGFLEAGYRRFIERKLREDFGFAGTPIEISVRVREKRKH
jgi:GTP-binding protein